MSFKSVEIFEKTISNFFGAPYGIAVDCCTHGIELCLRYTDADRMVVPTRTYPSIPMLCDKLNITRLWKQEPWEEFYSVTHRIIDAAVLWKKDSYIPGQFLVLSFQHKKHLSLGRGGMILTDNPSAYQALKKMSYDGRNLFSNKPWSDQNIDTIGYHYYMTPETATQGIHKFSDAICTEPKKWSYKDYPDLSKFKVFKNDFRS